LTGQAETGAKSGPEAIPDRIDHQQSACFREEDRHFYFVEKWRRRDRRDIRPLPFLFNVFPASIPRNFRIHAGLACWKFEFLTKKRPERIGSGSLSIILI
jgi:hypothetical protein